MNWWSISIAAMMSFWIYHQAQTQQSLEGTIAVPLFLQEDPCNQILDFKSSNSVENHFLLANHCLTHQRTQKVNTPSRQTLWKAAEILPPVIQEQNPKMIAALSKWMQDPLANQKPVPDMHSTWQFKQEYTDWELMQELSFFCTYTMLIPRTLLEYSQIERSIRHDIVQWCYRDHPASISHQLEALFQSSSTDRREQFETILRKLKD